VTVLFADVANYTTMAERLDPEEVHRVMDGCFQILMEEIHRREGTINQFMGDGIMAIFGAPQAHENHAQRACDAALAIQKALGAFSLDVKKEYGTDFTMRVGLNSGPVVVGAIGNDLRMDYTALGDTTNLAARMESAAKPGSILASSSTYRLTGDFFQFRPAGRILIKGKESGEQAYELLSGGEARTRIEAAAARGLSPFIGRESELKTIADAFDKARSGSGQLLEIMGEAGVGKSRLLFEARRALDHANCTYLEGRCRHHVPAISYVPLLDILKAYFEIKEEDQESAVRQKLEQALSQFDEALKKHLSSFHELFSLKFSDEGYQSLEAGEKKVRTFKALKRILIAASRERPLAVALEDVQWIDRVSEELLEGLLDALPRAHILLILVYRPEYVRQWGKQCRSIRIALGQFSEAQGARLVHSILADGDVHPDVVDLILRRTEGNPLFIEEIIRGLLENGTIEQKEGQFVLNADRESFEAPETVQGIVAARIDRLEEHLKWILQVASVIGREFSLPSLRLVTGVEDDELRTMLEELEELGLIAEQGPHEERQYFFKHALCQEVVYGGMLLGRRKELHEKMGRALESQNAANLQEFYQLLAHHYGRSTNNEKAFEYLRLANRKAAGICAMDEARAHFEKAMTILDDLPDDRENQKKRISLLTDQNVVFQLLWKLPEYYELLNAYQPVSTEIGNPGLLGVFYHRISHCDFWFGRLDQAIYAGMKAAALCTASGNIEDAACAYTGVGWSHLWKGDCRQALSCMKEALRLMEEQFNLRWYVWALSGACLAHTYLGRWDEALAYGQKGLKAAEEFSNNSLISFAAFVLSLMHTNIRDSGTAIAYGEVAVERATTPADKVWAKTCLGWAWCHAGKSTQGIEELRGVIPLYTASGNLPGYAFSSIMLGEGHFLAGQQEEAKTAIKEGLTAAGACGMKYHMAWAYRLLGDLASKADPEKASLRFQEGLACLQEIDAPYPLALTLASYGRFCALQGNTSEAREYLSKALEIFERLGTLIELGKVRKELAELP
jgi:class 3 adenylate cyclase